MNLFLLLALAAAPQLQGANSRELASEWRTSPPGLVALEARWQAADRSERLLLADAARLAKTADTLPVLVWAQEDSRFRGAEPWTTALLRNSIALGIMPGDGVLAERESEAAALYHQLVAEGWRPSDAQVEAALQRASVREPALMALLAAPALHFATMDLDTSGWTDAQQIYWDLHRAYFPEAVDMGARMQELPAEALLGPWNFEQRQIVGEALRNLGPSLPAGCLDGVWLQATIPQRSSFLPALQAAPENVAWDALRNCALSSSMAVVDRATATRRLFALNGERANADLLGLLSTGTPDALMQPTLFGMRSFGDRRSCDALETLIPDLKTPVLGAAFEVLVIWGDPRQQMLWKDFFPGFTATEKRSVLRAAMWAKQEGIESRLWDMRFEGSPEERGIGQAILREFLKSDAMAQGLIQRIRSIENLDHRIFELRGLARIDSDLAASAILAAYSDPAILQHPDSGVLAGRLFKVEEAMPMFEAWWSGETSVSEAMRYSAAAALASTKPECQAHLRDHFWDFTTGERIAAMSILRELPGAENFAAARRWMADSRLELPGRLHCATTIVSALPEHEAALHETYAVLRELRVPLALGLPIERVTGAFLLAAYDHPDDTLRSQVSALVAIARKGRAPSAEVIELRLRLKRARFGMASESMADSRARLLTELAWPGPVSPFDQPLQLGPISKTGPFLDFEVQLQLAFGADRMLTELSEALLARPAAWNPDRLWLLRERAAKSTPELLPVIDQLLADLEPLGSVRKVAQPSEYEFSPDFESDQVRFFARLESAVMGADLETAKKLARSGLQRFDGDRRLRQWMGWTMIAEHDLDGAQRCFTFADRIAGTLPYLHIEPTLGLAVVAELRNPSSSQLEDFLNYEEQAGTLMRARLPVKARPDLAALLPPESSSD